MGAVFSFVFKCSTCCDAEQQPKPEEPEPAHADIIELDEMPRVRKPAVDLKPVEVEAEEEIEEEMAKLAIQTKFKDITEQLSVDIRNVFAANLVSAPQYHHLQREEKYVGPIAMYDLLLRTILETDHAALFIHTLRRCDTTVYNELIPLIRQIGCGEVQVYGREIDEIRSNLIKVYEDRKYNVIKALSGEKFPLNVNNDDCMMPVDFSTMKMSKDEEQMQRLPEADVKVDYSYPEFDKVEDVVSALGFEEESNVVQVMADAGTGKTVAVHRIVCQWISDCKKKQGLGKQYDLVFAIALRDVNIDYSLVEMLCEGRNRLGYIPSNKLDEVEKILQNSQSASKVLFILDGLDEKSIPESSDIFKLLVGVAYKNVKVLFTCRPEAPILAKLKGMNPIFKVYINGTTEEGVYQYLRKTILKASDEELDDLVYECELKMVDFDILKIPIYLTIIGYVFNDYWNRHFSFQHFIIPDTVTKLFNIFISVLIRVWLERSGRKEEADHLQFLNNPVDKDSQVPRDIRSKLSLFGKLSFKSLLDECYDFRDHDLEKYLIAETDIAQCGMFCVSTSEDTPVYFYRHKQIQEYMAALYLSRERFDDMHFSGLIEHSLSKTGEKYTLKDVFTKIQRVMPFLFGLSPDFAADILCKLDCNVCVVKTNGFVDLHHEVMLCAEACNPRVTELMGDLLVSADIILHMYIKVRWPICTYISSAHKLLKGLSTTQRQTLLQKWYNLNLHKPKIDSRNITWDISNNSGSNNTLQIFALDEVLYFILCNYKFPFVKTLHLNYSEIYHPGLILSVFPSLTKLVLGNIELSVLDEYLESVIPQCATHTSLTQLIVPCSGENFAIKLPHCTVSSLLAQSGLRTLILDVVDIVSEMDLSCHIHWPDLHTLQLHVEKLDTMYPYLIHLLTGTPQLSVFSLGSEMHIKMSNPQVILPLLATLHSLTFESVDILSNLDVPCDIHWPHLNTLQMSGMEMTDTMYSCLTHLLTCMPQLKVFRLESYPRSKRSITNVLLPHLSRLHTLTLKHVDILTELDVCREIHFPHLHSLHIGVRELTDHMCASLAYLLSVMPQLTAFSLGSNHSCKLSSPHAVLPHLAINTLALYSVDLDISCDIHWPNLHTLKLHVYDLNETRCASLTDLLTGMPQLTVCSLQSENSYQPRDIPTIVEITKLGSYHPVDTPAEFVSVKQQGLYHPLVDTPPQVVSLIQHLTAMPKLSTLILDNILQHLDVLCERLQHMTGLVKLGLGLEELQKRGGRDPVLELSQALTSTPHITHLYVVHANHYLCKDEAECVVESLRQHCPPHVQVNLYEWIDSSILPI